MAEYLFLVDRQEKLQGIKEVVGDSVEVLVVDEWPASFTLTPQGQRGASVFSFQAIGSVWAPLVDRIAEYADVYYCFDTSMDGEYVSYLVDQLLLTSGGAMQGHRLHLAGVADDVIRRSLSMVEPISEQACLRYLQRNLFHKVFFSHLARLLGTTQGPGGVELSILTLAMLSLLAEQQTIVKQRPHQQKWEVEVRIAHGGQEISGRLAEVYGISSDGFLESGDQAKDVAQTLKGKTFTLVDHVGKELVFASPELYTLPDLVYDAYRFYRIAPGEVVAGVQVLFDGAGHKGGGLISSPYGVSGQNIQPVFERLASYVEETYGATYRLKDELGDGVILPLDPAVHPDNVQLPERLLRLYELVWSRSVASQMVDAVGKEEKVLFEVEGKRVSFSSLVLSSAGFLDVFKHGFDAVFTEETPFSFQSGHTVLVDAALPQQVKVQGAAQYNIGSLCDEMREMGFDDEKLILSVFQKILDHNYVMLSGAGEILCTSTLFKVTETLDRAFPRMKGLNLSAYYAQTLDEVMSGRKRVDVALKQFDQNLIMQGNPLVKVRVPTSIPKIKRKSRSVIKGDGAAVSRNVEGRSVSEAAAGFADFTETAPAEAEEVVAAAEEVEADSSPVAGAFQEQVVEEQPSGGEVEYAGDGHLDLQSRDDITAEPEAEEPAAELNPAVLAVAEDVFAQPDVPAEEPGVDTGPEVASAVPVEAIDLAAVETKECPECGRLMVVKDDRFGKFWACTGAPSCHHSQTYGQEEDVDKGQPCPACKRGELSVSRTTVGKDMYVCNDPSCGFMAWSKPYGIDCPLCGSSFLIEKKDRRGTVHLRCPMAGCSYVHGGEAGAESAAPKKKMVRVRRKKAGSAGGTKKRVVRRIKK